MPVSFLNKKKKQQPLNNSHLTDHSGYFKSTILLPGIWQVKNAASNSTKRNHFAVKDSFKY